MSVSPGHNELIPPPLCLSVVTLFCLLLLFQELEEIRKSGIRVFRDINVDESNILSWTGLIVPVSEVICMLEHISQSVYELIIQNWFCFSFDFHGLVWSMWSAHKYTRVNLIAPTGQPSWQNYKI